MSRFNIGQTTLRRRLAKKVDPTSWRILKRALDQQLRDSDAALWVDEPWDDIPFEDLEVDESQQVGCVVFQEPIDFEGEGFEPRDTRLLGYFQRRDRMTWVFLAPVSCSVFTTLPDAVCVFAGGLSVEGIACFAAPDSTTIVGRKLEADAVLSGRGDASVLLAPGCKFHATRGFDSYISSASPLESVVGEEIAEELEDASSWEVIAGLID